MTEIDALGAWIDTEEEGITEQSLWNLDKTLTDYILPRLQAFREMDRSGYHFVHKEHEEGLRPVDEKLNDQLAAYWENALFDMEAAFRTMKDTVDYERTPQQHEIIKRGLHLFAEYYEKLWD